MGIVYSPYKLENGLYPKSGAQQKALEEIMERLEANRIQKGEQASQNFMGFGSTAEDRANIRSDVDILVIVPDKFALQAISNFLEFSMDVNRKYHVEIDPILLTERQAQSANITLSGDSLFIDYLRDSQKEGHYVVGKPADYIEAATDEPSYYYDMLNYFSAKATSFQKAIPSSDADIDYRAYQRALELPAALHRKFRQATVPLKVDKEPIHSDYSMLQKYNQKYNIVLDETLEYDTVDRLDLKRYDKWLRDEYMGAVFRAARLSLMAYDRLDTDATLQNASAEGRL